jgi:predicted nucleic acid-binding protein
LTRFAVDSSVLVPVAVPSHEFHGRATSALDALLEQGNDLVIAAHSLLEVYAFLTRKRFRPVVAEQTVTDFASLGSVAAPQPQDYLNLIRRAGSQALAGGGVYDALIAATVVSAGATFILTLNPRHFERLDFGLDVRVP